MALSTSPCIGDGLGYGSPLMRDAHLEWVGNASWQGIPRSVSMWVRLEKPSKQGAACLAACTIGGAESLYLGTDESGETPELFAGTTTITTSNNVAIGFDWHHIGYRSDGTRHEMYIDGAFVAWLLCPPTEHAFDRIMLFSSTARAQFVGALRSVKLWSKQLSADALVAEGKLLGSVSDAAGLFAYWKLADLLDIHDYSGNARDLVASSGFFVTHPDPSAAQLTALARQPDLLPPEQPSA